MTLAVVGVDIGTSSSKGVLVSEDGTILATAVRTHEVSRPRPGWVEMSADAWWEEFSSITIELTDSIDADIRAVGVSGMGPCVLVTDDDGTPLRPAILYGVDTRATAEIDALNRQIGAAAILERSGSALSTQAVGPKLAWIAGNEPHIMERARRLFMPSSWLVWKLSGQYVLDHHSASQCTPLYDTANNSWHHPWADLIAPTIELPPLFWANETAGTVSLDAAVQTGLPAGIPVIAGTIDAWTEAVSVGAQNPGDLMLMYGTTMFLVATTEERVTVPSLWSTVGVYPGTRNLAGGMATSGAITGWLRKLFGAPDFAELLEEASLSGPGARGLLMLPYFAGERTPVMDPDARGIIAGLTLSHTRGDLYRAALEATAFGVRHNVEAMMDGGAKPTRIIAVGGGTQGGLWTQIVSDVTGLPQVIPSITIGASYGAALLAAASVTDVSIDDWNPPAHVVEPTPSLESDYNELYQVYRHLYPATKEISHLLAAKGRRNR